MHNARKILLFKGKQKIARKAYKIQVQRRLDTVLLKKFLKELKKTAHRRRDVQVYKQEE